MSKRFYGRSGWLVLLLALALGGPAIASAWQTDVVADRSAWAVSFALDAADSPQLVYYDPSISALVHAVTTDDGYAVSRVHEGENVVASALALGTDGQAYIIYIVEKDSGLNKVMAAAWTDDGWVSDKLDDDVRVSTVRLVLDSQGRPHAAYAATGGQAIRYAANSAGDWSVRTIASGPIATGLGLDVASDRSVRIVYGDSTTAALVLASNASGEWTFSTVKSDFIPGACAVGLGPNDEVHLAFTSLGSDDVGAVNHAVKSDDEWVFTELADDLFRPGVELIVDSWGRVKTAYGYLNQIYYAYYRDGAWRPAAQLPVSASAFSLALDSARLPRFGLADHLAEAAPPYSRPAYLHQTETESFVTRFYVICLDRWPDSDGLAGWVAAVDSGADAGRDTAHGFFHINEFLAREVDDRTYVNLLFEAMFDAAPTEDELAAAEERLAGGESRDVLFDEAAADERFDQLCARFGVAPRN